MDTFITSFKDITIQDIGRVGGKNASLGEMFQKLTPKGISIPDGFAITASAYWAFLKENGLSNILAQILEPLDTIHFSNLSTVGAAARAAIRQGSLPYQQEIQIIAAYQQLQERMGGDYSVAVRSSATAEDLPEASFAGQQESYLNIQGEEALLATCLKCYESLFTDRAIQYRVVHHFKHMEVALSIGVQQMVRSDLACAGVGFTLEPESGCREVIVLDGAWGLGENVVKGRIEPDEFIVFKPSLITGQKSIISKKLGGKQETLVYNDQVSATESTLNTKTPDSKREQFVLEDQEIETLARWSLIIEEHYQRPMDIEWAKDGLNGKLYIVQARPETVHTIQTSPVFKTYQLQKKGKVLATGSGLGHKIAAGKARILDSPKDAYKLQVGEILVTDITDPDWDPILKKAAAIVTNRGGRTSHAAIVAREQGAVAVVGTGDGTQKIKDGQAVTVSAAEGKTGFVYDGILAWKEQQIAQDQLQMPKTEVMLILGDPEKAFQQSMLPTDGIGLMRLEFIISNTIKTHPMALVDFDQVEGEEAKKEIEQLTRHYPSKPAYFVTKLSQAVATIAAAFHPRDVIVRMSDFKSNEYANLLGGQAFEPKEENPMLGFRGASRYYHKKYAAGFRLECEAMRVVRDEMGLTNVKLMIPFCRTPEEGRKVIDLMADCGLKQGENELEIYTMIEIPSNVILAPEFAKIFDGFSIGSNDLTQLTLGLDRDNSLIHSLFDENNPAIKQLISQTIEVAKSHHIKVGLCGQGPSDSPDFAQFLVTKGIDSISFNADALWQGIENINLAENKKQGVVLRSDPGHA